MPRLATLLALLPAMAAATPYDGTYKQTVNSDCGLVGVDGGALRIEGDIFFGVEMQCRMTRPVEVSLMDATLYTMECSGEGQAWTERAMVMKAAGESGDIIMVWNGFAFQYARCEAPDDGENAD